MYKGTWFPFHRISRDHTRIRDHKTAIFRQITGSKFPRKLASAPIIDQNSIEVLTKLTTDFVSLVTTSRDRPFANHQRAWHAYSISWYFLCAGATLLNANTIAKFAISPSAARHMCIVYIPPTEFINELAGQAVEGLRHPPLVWLRHEHRGATNVHAARISDAVQVSMPVHGNQPFTIVFGLVFCHILSLFTRDPFIEAATKSGFEEQVNLFSVIRPRLLA